MSVAAKRILMAVAVTVFSISMTFNAWAGECEDGLEKCQKKCTKQALGADSPEEFKEMTDLDGPCESRCFTRSGKCQIKAVDKKNAGKVKKIIKSRKKSYAKLCEKRFQKLMGKCTKTANKDLGKLKSCYKKKVRPAILDCYEEIDKGLPFPGGEES
ncbi:MAG: hypothetical protein JEZ11_15190 [Desulfobacterales bacterium]|nr:hypothetical protein [Desulfobacterales bacterium]